MAYALGRRVEYFDQPTIRAIARQAGDERLPDVVVHPRRGEERRVPDEASRANGNRGRGRGARAVASEATRRQKAMHVPHWQAHAPPHDSSAASAPPSRCRSWTRWSRRGGGRRLRPGPRSSAPGWCASRRCTGFPAATSGARRSTCSLRRPRGRDFELLPDNAAEPAGAVPGLPDDHQQHRRAHGGGVRRRRRSAATTSARARSS